LQISCYGICNKFVLSKLEICKLYFRLKIGPYHERIALTIDEDKYYPEKRSRTAKHIFERSKEIGYAGGSTQVKEAVREIKRLKPQVFIPLIPRPLAAGRFILVTYWI